MNAPTSSATARRFAGTPVLLLGAGGFIGRWVARALTSGGATLTLTDRSRDAMAPVLEEWEARGEIVEADLTDAATLRALLQRVRPAVVFNLAGYGVNPAERDEALATGVNAELPERLAETLAAVEGAPWSGARLVHVGSAYEYGAIDGDLAEDSTPAPVTLYGRTKLEGTRRLSAACARHGLRGVTARLFMVYGAGEHPARLLPSLIEAARRGEPLALTDGTQRRDFTSVEDVAEGLLLLALAAPDPGDVVNLATGTLTPVRGFAETAARVLGIPAERLRFGALPTRGEEMAHEPVRIERLRRLTGWSPAIGIEDGIARAAAFGRRHAARSTR